MVLKARHQPVQQLLEFNKVIHTIYFRRYHLETGKNPNISQEKKKTYFKGKFYILEHTY